MRQLSFLGLGECLVSRKDTDESTISVFINSLKVITQKYADSTLHEDYPRYPPYKDKNIADDAQYLLGKCCEKMGNKKNALAEYAKVCRFYPKLDKCKDLSAEKKVEELRKDK